MVATVRRLTLPEFEDFWKECCRIRLTEIMKIRPEFIIKVELIDKLCREKIFDKSRERVV